MFRNQTLTGYDKHFYKHARIQLMTVPTFYSDKLDDAILTPKEYISYLVFRGQFAEHLNGIFKPQAYFCPICLIEYDIIGHVETFQEDVLFVMNSLQITV